MTDRINSITLILEDDMRIDDAQRLIDALWCFEGVADVSPNLVTSQDSIAALRAESKIRGSLLKYIRDNI